MNPSANIWIRCSQVYIMHIWSLPNYNVVWWWLQFWISFSGQWWCLKCKRFISTFWWQLFILYLLHFDNVNVQQTRNKKKENAFVYSMLISRKIIFYGCKHCRPHKIYPKISLVNPLWSYLVFTEWWLKVYESYLL